MEQEKSRKPHEAKVAVTNAKATEKAPKKCRFTGVLGCTGTHLPWMRRASETKPQRKGQDH
jgi:hypothetical protein